MVVIGGFIAGEAFLSLEGPIKRMGTQMESFTRPGEDGVGLHEIGQRSEPSTLRTSIDVVGPAGRQAKLDAYTALEGQIVTVRDGHGNEIPDVWVIRCAEERTQAVAAFVGGFNESPTDVLWWNWDVQQVDS